MVRSAFLNRRAVVWIDVALIAALFVGGAVLGRSVLRAQARPVFFYQTYLGEAVLEACGLGFHRFEADPAPTVLSDFLQRKTFTLSCDDLPSDARLAPPNWFAQMHRYLAASLTLVWRLRGIDWNVLATLFEVASGLVAALTYGIGRLGLNRFWSAVVAIGVAASGLNLGYLPWLRDYSKAPFLLASLLVCALIVTGAASRRQLLLLSIAQGAILGIGLGFRTDVLVAIPLFVVVVALLLPPVLRPTIALRGAAVLVFAATFVLTGWPVLRAYGQGANTPHVMLLGFAQAFDQRLGIAPADYVVSPTYWDLQTEMQVRAFASATGGDDWAVVTSTPYDRAAGRYLRELATTLPADILVRTYGAILAVLRLPVSPAEVQECTALQPSLAGSACAVRQVILKPLRWFLLPASFLVLVLVAATSFRIAGFLCAALVVFAGTAMLQYDPRHVFYLEVLPLWALAFFGQHLGTAARGIGSFVGGGLTRIDDDSKRRIVRGGCAALVLVAAAAGVLSLARLWQQSTLEPVLARYRSTEVDPVPIVWTTDERDEALEPPPAGVARVSTSSLLAPLDPLSWTSDSLRAEIFRAELGGETCRGRDVPITLRYHTRFDSTVLEIPAVFTWATPADGSTTHVFFPAYRALIARPSEPVPSGEFMMPGIDLRAADVSCLVSLARVRNPAAFPIQIAVRVGPEDRKPRLYQRLAGWDGPATEP